MQRSWVGRNIGTFSARHNFGEWTWDAAKEEAYANYLGDPGHLVAIRSRHNRSKGVRGPDGVVAPDASLWHSYATY